MNSKSYLWIGAGAALALAFALTVLIAPQASATNDPDAAGGSVYGDWTVTDSRSYDSVTIYLESGNLTVASGGSLSLNNVRLRFNTTYDSLYDGNYSLEVQAGGTLTTTARTNISSNQTNVHYKFIARGTLTMNDSSASEMWGDNASWAGGIQIYSDQTSITCSTIYNGRTGGISIFSCSPTVSGNNVRNNGQDGGNRTYCFGIYAYKTNTNFSFNNVFENTYSLYTYYRLDKQGSPSGSGYYWNGNWYYYYYYYQYYRYEYNYRYTRGAMYGTGIYIEGQSNAVLAGNSIYRNGWAAGGSYSYNYNVWEDATHQIMYQYTYNYAANTLYGTGVYIADSNAEVTGNYFDRNGLDQSSTYSGDYICTYHGTAIKLVNTPANLSANRILNSATLVYNIRSNSTIVNNTLTANYGAYAFIGDRTGYGIRNERSSPIITGNTMKLTVQDYYIYMGSSYMYPMDFMLGIENLYSPNVLIRNCKITTESTGYGYTNAIGVNASLKSSGMQILDSTIEYSFSGYSYGTPGKPIGVQFSLLSGGRIDNCTIKTSVGTGAGPVTTGVMVAYGSSVVLVNSSIPGAGVGVYITDYSTIDISATKITGVTNIGVRSDYASEATLKNVKVNGNGRGNMVVQGKIKIRDCELNNPLEFVLDKAGTIDVYNTPHVKGSAQVLDMDSYLNVWWPVTLSVAWQSDAPADGASVKIATMSGIAVFTGTTNESGTLPEMLWIKEYMGHNMVVTKFTPHRISVTKGRATSTDFFLIDRAINIVFRLVDSVPPDLVVKYPFDGQKLNVSKVTFMGTASDAEAGLLDGVIEINVDNTGWVGIPVKEQDTTWSLTRPLGDGTHIVRIKAMDLAGNVARVAMTISVDTSGPVLQVFTPVEGSSTNQRTVTVTGVTEDGAFVTVNGISVDVVKRMFSKQISLDFGPNLIVVVASDSSANSRSAQVHVTFDVQPPLLDIRSPRNGDYTNQDPLSVLGSSEPNAVIKVNGVRTQLVNSSFESLVGMSEGANTVTVTAQDLAGNLATMVITVYLDTAAPGLTVFSPRDGLWTNQSKVLINGATEQGGLVTINGQNTNVVSTIFSGYVGLLEGANRIELVARDPAGNSQSLVRTVYLDTRRPDLIVTSPGDRLVSGSRVVPVVGSVDYGAEVRVEGELVKVTDFVFSTTVSYSEDGSHVIEITARDLAGNLARTTRTVLVDTTTPSIILSYPTDGIRVKQRLITVSGQTEPFSTVIVNTETLLVVGRDGLFQLPVVLEDGENRVTVTATDAAGNSQTSSVTVIKPVTKAAVAEDVSWVLNLTGLLVGIGIALPIMTHTLTSSWRRRREGVLAEMEAAEGARKEREAESARRAAMPTVEKMGKKRVKMVEAPKEEKAPAVLPEAPKAEAAEPEVAKTGLRDKSGATEVSPDEIDQQTKMKGKTESPAVEKKAPAGEPAESSLKDKGGESEHGAGDTEIQGAKKK